MSRITQKAPYGQHITLTCKKHPLLNWSTKNISPIGARSIFYNLDSDETMGRECDCPASNLEVHPMYVAMADVPE